MSMELLNKVRELQRQVAELQDKVKALEALSARKTLSLPKDKAA